MKITIILALTFAAVCALQAQSIPEDPCSRIFREISSRMWKPTLARNGPTVILPIVMPSVQNRA